MYDSLSKYYDLFADSDDESRAGYIASFLPEGGRGADLGCGTGGVTLALKIRRNRIRFVRRNARRGLRAGGG